MPGSYPSLRQRCTAISLLVLDVDGVLTNGQIVLADDGLEAKAFHVRDGTALKIWGQAGKRTAVITGRTSATVVRRAAEVGIDRVLQGTADKLSAFRQLLEQEGRFASEVCYVGDDLPDLAPMLHCGLAVAVADACPEILAKAHYITRTPGGGGGVREVIELILRCQGHRPSEP
jgi:3-deoxy-D-manno-octulosonate 8-phosphate phosphatase (KDO 8-P phosphatase)